MSKIKLYRENYIDDPYKTDDNYYLVCKQTGTIIPKWERTRVLSNWLKEINQITDESYPKNSRSRHKYFYVNKTYWYMKYFDLKHKSEIDDFSKLIQRKRKRTNQPFVRTEPTVEQYNQNYKIDILAGDENYKLKCKVTGKTIQFWSVMTGVINHLKNNNIDYTLPKNHKERIVYYYENRTYWYMEHFDVIYERHIPVVEAEKPPKDPITMKKYIAHYKSDEKIKSDEWAMKCKNTGICLVTKKNSNAMSNHLRNNGIQFTIPPKNIKIKTYYHEGIYWYNEFFDYIKVGDIKDEKIKVPLDTPYPDDIHSSDSTKGLKCKVTGKVFTTWSNTTGLTNYLKEKGIEFNQPPTVHARKRYYQENNNFWYMEYFELVDIVPEKRKKCPYCDETFLDEHQIGGWYKKHLIEEHDVVPETHLEKYPEDEVYFNKYLLEKERREDIEKDGVECKVCGEKFKKISGNHLKKHGLTMLEYIIKFPNSEVCAMSTKDKMYDIWKNNKALSGGTNRSKSEEELCNFLDSINIEYRHSVNDIIKGQLDIYIPSHKIAIEYNGNYYHSDLYRKNVYHLNKTEQCEELGIHLIHIFSDEWKDHEDIVKNRLKTLFNVPKQVVYARKCEVKEIGTHKKNVFLNSHHIQGEDKSKVKIGTFYNDKLIAIMTFKSSGELSRYCLHPDYAVTGLFNKLLKYYIKNYKPTEITTFADRRWTSTIKDNVYSKNGFTLDNISKPNYTYYTSKSVWKNKRYHKSNFMKSKLIKRFPNHNLDMSMTEREMTLILGFNRIYDCGLLKYKLEL